MFASEMPLLYPVRQRLHKTCITNFEAYFRDIVSGAGFLFGDINGKKAGICVGSRGICDILSMVKILVEYIKDKGAEAVIIPCMGSHGGATAEGQASMIAGFGITEAQVGAKVSSSMDVIDAGPTRSGLKAHIDAIAAGCDFLVIINRIKEHTDFTSNLESGLVKMLAVGLGNHAGASYIHSFGVRGLTGFIPEIAARIIETKRIIGVGIVEDGYSRVDRMEVIAGSEIFTMEKVLLKYAKSIKARIPFKKVDYLVIEEIGKEISGSGMDTKVIGRIKYQGVDEPESPQPDIIACLRLTPASHGNAAGVGLADVISKKLYDSINFNTMYTNARTSKCPERYKIPMYLEDDKAAVLTGLEFARTSQTFGNRVVFIKNTSFLELIYVSKPLLDEAKSMDGIEIVPSMGMTIPYTNDGDYLGLFNVFL
jgi:hypothetical protein